MPQPIYIALALAMLTSASIKAQPHGANNLDEQAIDSLSSRLERQLKDGDYLQYARTAEVLSDAYVMSGDFDQAKQVYHNAGDICQQNGLYKWYGAFKKNVAEIDFMTGRIDDARGLLENLSESQEIPDYEMTAIRFRLGDLECDLGNYDRGIQILESSLDLAQRSQYGTLLGSIYTELGLCVDISGSKVRATDYLIKAIPYLQAPKHARVLGHNYLVLSELFDQIGQMDKSLEYLEKGKQIAFDNNYDRLYHRAMYIEGRQDLARRPESAIAKLDTALQFYEKNYLTQQAIIVALDIASSYISRSMSDPAKSYLERIRSMLDQVDNPVQEAKYYEHLTRYHILSDALTKARIAFAKNRTFADSVGGRMLMQRSLGLETELLQAEKKYREALVANYKYHAFKDSINTLAQNQILFETEAKYQKEENEKAIELLSAQNQVKDLEIQRASRRNLMLLVGLLTLALIIGAGIYSYQLKKRTNRELAEKNELISKALSEKELLLKEIHHRVKNNLEVISGLLYLQSKYVEDENVLEAIREGQNRVRSMSLIHKNLYQDDNLTGIRIDEYFDKLIDTLLKSYKVGRQDIEVRNEIEPINLDVDTVIPLALIVNELISNALKYAFNGDIQGKLELSLKRHKKAIELIVSDNGPGMPPDFDISQTTSLGYKLIDLFTKKLEGTLQVVNDEGASIVLRFTKFKVV